MVIIFHLNLLDILNFKVAVSSHEKGFLIFRPHFFLRCLFYLGLRVMPQRFDSLCLFGIDLLLNWQMSVDLRVPRLLESTLFGQRLVFLEFIPQEGFCVKFYFPVVFDNCFDFVNIDRSFLSVV